MAYIIDRAYRFYASHRNPLMNNKCSNLHGHRYGVVVSLKFEKLKPAGEGLLFSEIDKVVEPIIKNLDHAHLSWDEDPLLRYLRAYEEDTGTFLNIVVFPHQTTAELIAKHLFERIKSRGLPIVRVQLKETDSSEVIYQP